MKNMTQNIEYSLAEVLARIDNRLDKLDQKIESKFDLLDQKINKLDDKVDKLSNNFSELKGEMSGINKRLDNLEFIARTVGGAMIVAVLLGIAKFLFPSLSV